MSNKSCQVEGCERPHKAHGYCATHYKQFQRGAEIAPIIKRDYGHGLICSVEGCDQPEKARGLCATHYKRWQRHGNAKIAYKPWGAR